MEAIAAEDSDAECTAEENRPLTQGEEEEFTDVSVEMECCDDEKEEEEEEEEEEEKGEEEEEEEKGEETPEEEETEPKGGNERNEEGGGEEDEEDEEEECRETDAAVKPRKSRMECHDCGKKFTRRETYNLHRHFHMHQDEQASLTCKECGLTFQHRSSLIKHRTEHKRNGVPRPALTSRRRAHRREFKDEMYLECDHCGERFASVVRYRLHACLQTLEKPYRCPLCRREFQYRVSINAHMKSHSLDSPYRCLECNKGFQCAVTLHIHQRSHAALKPYECPDCGMVFRHRSFMEDHRRRHAEERPHQCKICGKSFKFSSLLQQHQYLHTGQKPYRCSECGKRFAFAQNMRAHSRQHRKNPGFVSTVGHITNHDVTYGKDLVTVDKENENHKVEKQRNCPLCPMLFFRAADLREHMLMHEAEYEKLSNGKNSDQVYACPYCPLTFFNEPTLQSHVLTHQVLSAPLKREVLSGARASSTDNMPGGGEWGDQTEKKLLKCKDCGKSFRYRSVLELHMRIHNKGYQCQICKKSFRFSSYLQQHLIIHSGKKPYKCPDCGKDFAFLQNMKTHQRLHQQKPFRCTQCRKGYSDESQLQRHMLSHSGEKPHKCHLCDKSFGLAYLLRDHLNTHTGERPHRCQECHKSFPWLSSLLVHQKIHARKRQAMNQSYSSLTVVQRGRTRGVGGRGRRNSRWISSWPRMGGDSGRTMDPLSGQILQGPVPPNMIGQQSSISDEQAQLRSSQSLQAWQAETQSRPVQLQKQWQIHIKPQLQHQQQSKWMCDGPLNDVKQQWSTGVHLKPILPKLEGLPQPQQNPAWTEVVMSAQASPAPKQHVNSHTIQDKGVAALAPVMCFTPEQEQKKQKQPPFRPRSPGTKSPEDADESLDMRTRSPLSKTLNTSDNLSGSSDVTQNAKDDLTSVKDKTVLKSPNGSLQANSDSDETIGSGDDKPQGKAKQTGQATDESKSKPWMFSIPLEKTLNVQSKNTNGTDAPQSQLRIMQHSSQQQLQLVLQPPPQMQLLQQPLQQLHQEQLQQHFQLLQQQQFHRSQLPQQQPSTWDGAPQPNQLRTISIQLGAARFAPGPGSTVWGFHATPIVSQALINGAIQQGSVRAQQQAPVVSGPQILLNQTSPFISPPIPLPSPLALPSPHQIQLPGPAPQGMFFTPQGLVGERPVMPQALPSSHLAQQTEPHKSGGQVLFGSDRRFHCMVCGCMLPGELELQMHYMQHAQGEI